MKKPIFGQRPSQQTPPSSPSAGERGKNAPGHSQMLAYLRDIEAREPLKRSQVVGGLLFDMVCKMIANDRGVRMEDLIAILASTGGFSCLLAAMNQIQAGGSVPENSLNVAEGRDGYRYFFGNLPNHYLIESKTALLNLTLAAAQSVGGDITMDAVLQTARHVADTVGGERFGLPLLPEENSLSDLPVNYVRHLWPEVLGALQLYEVPPANWPTAFGFALQRAILDGKDAIDPALAAHIAIECAIPMAKLDPGRIT